MPKQPLDHSEPLVAFIYAGMVDEPNGPHGGQGINHEQNNQEQYPWPEQVPASYKPDPLPGENRNSPREAGGRQDKTAGLRDRRGSGEPEPRGNGARSQPAGHKFPGTNNERVKNRPAKQGTGQHPAKPVKRRTVHTVSWMKPALKAELERIAKRNGLSLSATVASLLQHAVERDLHEQHDALLEPLVRQAVRHEMRGLGNRLASLLVSILFVGFQIRQLLVNVLVRVPADPQMSEAVLNDIRDGSAQRARQEVRQRSPQLKTLIAEEMARWND